MSKGDGGAAFPSPGVVIGYETNERQQGAYEGMSLRDYFAAKAMQGICSHHDNWGLMQNGIAKHAYEMADAMLAERAK